jgi:hypothetical protein
MYYVMLTLGIVASNMFSHEYSFIKEKYYLAYVFMGTLSALTLVLFYYVFKTRPFEEDVEKDDESALV